MLTDCTSLDDYITRHQVDGVLWKAEKLLTNIDNAILKQDRVEEIAHTIAMIPKPVAREQYAKKIGKQFDISWPTFKQIIEEHLGIHKRKENVKNKAVRKNTVQRLEGKPEQWPFIIEKLKENKDGGDPIFMGIEIDEFKFIQLMVSFGFVRYESNTEQTGKDEFQFVRLEDNIIRSVTRQQIIDEIEKFILNKYDFSRFEHITAEKVINVFYKSLNRYFSQDKFARMKPTDTIIINRDTKTQTFFYFKNGFVEVDKDGWTLRSYDEMNGSVWDKQMIERKFDHLGKEFLEGDIDIKTTGVFSDFCLKICGDNADRFAKLTAILGYLMHDYYEYKLKAINLTDSSLSEASEGRTGKTLLAKMLGHVKGFTEINAKDFKATDERKYQLVDLGTQILHLNDLKTRGQNKFDFEDVFNDITEGYMVRKMYQAPFRQCSKFVMSSNKTLNIVGASQRDRIIEFEMSQFFGEHLSPEQHYKQWFGRDWDEQEWARFYNFMCFCSCMFHRQGLEAPAPINLSARKLMNHTSREFLDFMEDCRKLVEVDGKPFHGYNLPDTIRINFTDLRGTKPVSTFISPCTDFYVFQFDKNQLYNEFTRQYQDFKKWLTQNKFNVWLSMYAELELKIKHPRDWRSNGVHFIQFVETKNLK